MSKKTEIDYRTTKEYAEGREDYVQNGSRNMKCPDSPYSGGAEKIGWLIGWLDNRTADVLGN